MIEIDVSTYINGATMFLKEMEPSCRRAAYRALNRTATTVRADAARLLQGERALLIGTIKSQMFVKRATLRNLRAKIGVKGGPISMRHFAYLRFETTKGQRTGISGITYKVKKADRRKLLKRGNRKAFTNPMLGGGVTIFVRRGPSRLPIMKWAPVPGLPHSLVSNAVETAIRTTAVRVFQQRYDHEVRYEIRRQQQKHAKRQVRA